MAGGPTRRQARERALELLYEAEAKGVDPNEVVAGLPVAPEPYAVALAGGVYEHGSTIDEVIGRLARGWRLDRMPAVDRALLRIAIYELAHEPTVPTGVAISEAVALAKQYSTDDSGRFINGLLSRAAAELPRSVIRLPDPPIDDGEVRLRPWRAKDAAALAAAWADPDVQRWTAVPAADRRSETDAARWIAGAADRLDRGVALDLVVVENGDDDTVLGEVGLVPAPGADIASIGWWVAPAARRRGVASRAVGLLARWAERELGVTVVAEVDPANMVSLRVAENAGIRIRLRP